MSKKYKKRNTKIVKDSLRSMSQQSSKINRLLSFLKNIPSLKIWKLISITSILLNFILSYYALSPDVSIEYASYLIPKSLLGLPLKICNHGYLPIRNVKIIFEADIKHPLFHLVNKGDFKLNKKDLCNELGAKKSINYIYDDLRVMNNSPDWPSNGFLLVTLKYQLFLFPKIFEEQQKFKIYKSQDGYTRWIATQ